MLQSRQLLFPGLTPFVRVLITTSEHRNFIRKRGVFVLIRVIAVAPRELRSFRDTECCWRTRVHKKTMEMLKAVFLFRSFPVNHKMEVKQTTGLYKGR